MKYHIKMDTLAEPWNTRICTNCRVDKHMTEYYLRDGVTPFRMCKACILAKRPKKPRNGWMALPEATREAVKKDLADRRNKIKDIAEAHGINYSNLCLFIRSGRCV